MSSFIACRWKISFFVTEIFRTSWSLTNHSVTWGHFFTNLQKKKIRAINFFTGDLCVQNSNTLTKDKGEFNYLRILMQFSVLIFSADFAITFWKSWSPRLTYSSKLSLLVCAASSPESSPDVFRNIASFAHHSGTADNFSTMKTSVQIKIHTVHIGIHVFLFTRLYNYMSICWHVYLFTRLYF